MARTAEPYPAAFSQLEQLMAPEDAIAVRLWGLTGWSMNWCIVVTELFAVMVVVPFALGLRGLYGADVAFCVSAGVLLSASWWTRSVLVIAITSQHQLLCCRISRPFPRKTITRAPAAVRVVCRLPSWLAVRPAPLPRARHQWQDRSAQHSRPVPAGCPDSDRVSAPDSPELDLTGQPWIRRPTHHERHERMGRWLTGSRYWLPACLARSQISSPDSPITRPLVRKK